MVFHGEEVKRRQIKYGENKIEDVKKRSLFLMFISQFANVMILVLIFAAIISAIISKINGEGYLNTIVIFGVVILNAIIGTQQEYKAEKALEELQKISENKAKVLRDGVLIEVTAHELTLGDIVILETGDFVPADLRIIESYNFYVDESHLTGESEPVEKNANTINDEKITIGDIKNMTFTSSLVTMGRAKAVVVKIGMNTEVGKIAAMIKDTKPPTTPIQEKINSLTKSLVFYAILACIIIFLIGIFYGKSWMTMLMLSVSLAVSATPEGLPAITTVVLAIGVQRLVEKNAIVKKLPAVETLGSVSVICSDKTGTLTKNMMTVKKLYYNGKICNIDEVENLNENQTLSKLVTGFMFCNDTKISKTGLTGDPTEVALTRMAFENFGFDSNSLFWYERVAELPFDSNRKVMTTVNKIGDKYVVFTKGGLDEVLSRCIAYEINNEITTDESKFLGYKGELLYSNEKLARDALRVLAIGYKILNEQPKMHEYKYLEQDLIFLGMAGMIDPPREEVKDSIHTCIEAGIKPIMITGDHKVTAEAIARDLGILKEGNLVLTGVELDFMSDEEFKKNLDKYRVYARVSPENKLRIVEAWQEKDKYVAMTGDRCK